MSAFAAAAAALHSDPNGSVAAVYRSRAQGPGLPIRVIPSQPDAESMIFGQAIRITNVVLSVLVADAPDLQQGDAFDLPDRRVLAIDRKLDAEGANWMVACRNG